MTEGQITVLLDLANQSGWTREQTAAEIMYVVRCQSFKEDMDMDQIKQALRDHLVSWHKMTELEAGVALLEAQGHVISSSLEKDQSKIYISLSIGIPHICKPGCLVQR